MDARRTNPMSRIRLPLLLMMLLAGGSVHAQSPTGTIAGVITDQNGARVAGARVTISNRDTGLVRNVTTSVQGEFDAAALPSGVYTIVAEATDFRRLERIATVEAGTTTTV